MRSDRDSSFRDYVAAHRSALTGTAVLLTAGDRWAAEDLVQTTLTRLYSAWNRIPADARDGYVRRSLTNAFIDERRSAWSRRERAHPELPESSSASETIGVPSIDRGSAVFRALAELPLRMRAAVVMRHLLDMSVEETAQALGCRPGTVRSQTARGLDRLAAQLARSGLRVDTRADADPDTDADTEAAGATTSALARFLPSPPTTTQLPTR